MPMAMIIMRNTIHIIIRPIEPPEAFDLGQHQLEQLLAANQIKMSADAGVLRGKPLKPATEHLLAQLGLDLSGEAGVEVVEHLDVEEQDGSLGEFCGDGVQKHFGAVVLVFERLALARLDSHDAHVDDVGAIAEEDRFPACFVTNC